MLHDSKGNIWVGTTQGGLHVYTPENDTTICYNSIVNPDIGFDGGKIYDVIEDVKGNIWASAKNGAFVK